MSVNRKTNIVTKLRLVQKLRDIIFVNHAFPQTVQAGKRAHDALIEENLT